MPHCVGLAKIHAGAWDANNLRALRPAPLLLPTLAVTITVCAVLQGAGLFGPTVRAVPTQPKSAMRRQLRP